MGGEGAQASIAASNFSRFFGTDTFEMSMSLKADSAASWGEVTRIHTSLVTRVEQDGNFRIVMTVNDNHMIDLTSSGVNLADGAQHDVTVRFDGHAGFVEIEINGQIVASDTVSGVLYGKPRSLDFGNPWGQQNFEGEISAFSLSAASRDYPIYNGASGVISESQTTEPEPIISESDNTPSSETIGTENTNETSDPAPVEPDNGTATEADIMPEEDSGMIEPMLKSGYQLNFAAIATSDTIKLHDNAHVVDSLDGPALSFDGKRDFVELGRLTELEASQEIAFSVDFTSENATNRPERLVWNHEKIGLSLEGDGVRVHVGNTSSKFDEGFLVTGLGLNDGNQHSATVMVDAETDRLQIIVDDVLVLDKDDVDFDFVGAGGHEWGWSLGTSWNRWFEGEVHQFQVSDDFSFVETQAVDVNLLI
jgi:hypothetical protein